MRTTVYGLQLIAYTHDTRLFVLLLCTGRDC
jgi:hypothetical protein